MAPKRDVRQVRHERTKTTGTLPKRDPRSKALRTPGYTLTTQHTAQTDRSCCSCGSLLRPPWSNRRYLPSSYMQNPLTMPVPPSYHNNLSRYSRIAITRALVTQTSCKLQIIVLAVLFMPMCACDQPAPRFAALMK